MISSAEWSAATDAYLHQNMKLIVGFEDLNES